MVPPQERLALKQAIEAAQEEVQRVDANSVKVDDDFITDDALMTLDLHGGYCCWCQVHKLLMPWLYRLLARLH